MSTITDNKGFELLTQEYLPLGQMLKLMSEESNFPYKSRFSFKPYLDEVSMKMCGACNNTKGLLIPLVENANEYIESGEADLDSMMQHEHFRTMVSLVVPSMFFKNDRSFLCPPFQTKILVSTPAFQEMIESDKWELKLDQEKLLNNRHSSIRKPFIYILNEFYNQKIDLKTNELITLKNKETGIERHYHIELKFDFVNVTSTKTLPRLSQAQINRLIERLDDEEFMLKYLPADHFEFTGFALGNFHDVSELEVLSQFKHWLNARTKDIRPEHFLEQLVKYLQSYLNISAIKTGSIMTEKKDIHRNDVFSLTNHAPILDMLNDKHELPDAGVYGRLIHNKQVVVCEDLTYIAAPSFLEKKLLDNNIESVILYPVIGKNETVVSVLEIGSPVRNTFNANIVDKLKPFFEILDSGYDLYMQELDNRITNIIQQKFTSIHPSVQWKFENAALKYLSNKIYEEGVVDFDPILFNDVYPLYAQSDIVGSTKLRNQAIQADLIENLEALSELIDKWFKKGKNHLLESYRIKVLKLLDNLKVKFVANDETTIVNLLVNEIHPLLQRLHLRHSNLSKKVYQKYLNILDPELNIVYNRRKAFENSVTQVIMAISEHIEKENEELQKELPHFFEKYKTDGVEYNLYLGQSILKDGDFSPDDLRNFKLWQLVNTCEIVRLVEDIRPSLEVSLETAQLIFVYNQSLSIRFRMDEKQFDVDGAYNVRYEILKKRIDKAIIKGTKERLTVAGKIAIVYLSEKEKQEYLEFFEYLSEKGYIHEEFEDLELDKLQGAEGLKALRITVAV